MSEYVVQVVAFGRCPASSLARIDERLGKSGRVTFQTTDGRHVSIWKMPYEQYEISVWWATKPNGSFIPSVAPAPLPLAP